MLGLRLKGYEKTIQQNMEEMMQEMLKKGKPKWYKFDTDQLTEGAIMIILYGDLQ